MPLNPKQIASDAIARGDLKLPETGYTCCKCGRPMLFNVPRLGPDGGFIHAGTYSLMCPETLVEPTVKFCLPAEAGIDAVKVPPKVERPPHARKNPQPNRYVVTPSSLVSRGVLTQKKLNQLKSKL